LGYEPFLVLKSKGGHITVADNAGVREKEGNPFEELRSYLQAFSTERGETSPPLTGLPAICRTGLAVGYLGYDLHHFLERLPKNTVDDLGLPDMYFGFYDELVVYDHKEDRCFLVGRSLKEEDVQEFTALLSTSGKEEKGSRSVPARLARCSNRATRGRTLPLGGKKRYSLKGNFTKKDYLEAVKRAKEYIASGDIYQVNLSQRFQTELDCAPHELYLRLRGINPAPFSAYLQFEDNAIVSSSPERFLRLQSGRVQTCPIKGTRPRGRDLVSDQRLMAELFHSPKDNAELTMIVDLERNDLGKVCNYGSVKVMEKKRLEVHPSVLHLVATVEGDLYPEYGPVDLLKATFPGGSITGAPKLRAMEIIDELEPTSRGIYTGAIGYIAFDGHMDLSMAIRTFLIKGSTAFFQVGGGIVADSRPGEEYEETLFKSRALIESLYKF
jgi:para-aminobenzoate synthetase component 1